MVIIAGIAPGHRGKEGKNESNLHCDLADFFSFLPSCFVPSCFFQSLEIKVVMRLASSVLLLYLPASP